MKKLAMIFALLAGAVLAHSQNTTTSGTITLQAASCAGASAGYVYYILPTNTSAVAVTISGTWSATLQFVGSVNGTTWTSVNATPIPTASAVTSTTANGTWTINPAGLAEVCVYASSYASGKAQIAASAQTGVASGGYVAQIVAGTGITLSPSGGTGNVTINAAGGAAAGSTSQLQYNNSGAFAGAAGGLTSGTHWAFGAGSVVDGVPSTDPFGDPVSTKAIANYEETYTGSDFENGQVINLTLNPSTPEIGNTPYATWSQLNLADGPNWSPHDNGVVGGLFVVNENINAPNLSTAGVNALIAFVLINGTAELPSSATASFGFGAASTATVDGASSIELTPGNFGGGVINSATNLLIDYGNADGTTASLDQILINTPTADADDPIPTIVGLHIGEQCITGTGSTACHEIQSDGTGPSLIAGQMTFGDLISPGILTLSDGTAHIATAGGDGWQFNCSDCDTPVTEGVTCTASGDHAGALAIQLRGALKCF